VSTLRIASPGQPPVTIYVDGIPVDAWEGETVAAALIAAGHSILRFTPRLRQPRGIFCGMGICYDCVVVLSGAGAVRACMTRVRPNIRIETGAARPGKSGRPE